MTGLLPGPQHCMLKVKDRVKSRLAEETEGRVSGQSRQGPLLMVSRTRRLESMVQD